MMYLSRMRIAGSNQHPSDCSIVQQSEHAHAGLRTWEIRNPSDCIRKGYDNAATPRYGNPGKRGSRKKQNRAAAGSFVFLDQPRCHGFRSLAFGSPRNDSPALKRDLTQWNESLS
jgi:hypothetical protein